MHFVHGRCLLRTDDPTTLGRRSKLRDIDWNLRRADTDSETVDEASSDEHANILRGAGNSGTNEPDGTTNLDRPPTTELVREVARSEGTDERASRHRSCDSTLDISLGARAGR